MSIIIFRMEVIIFNYKAHIFISLAILTSILYFLDIESKYYLLLLSGCVYGSILPDCDLRHSVAGFFFPLWLLFENKAKQKINTANYVIKQKDNKFLLIVNDTFYKEFENQIDAENERNKKIKEDIAYYYHRTYTHSIIAISILLTIYLIYNLVIFKTKAYSNDALLYVNISFIGLIIGYILHILVDSFNKTGVKFFYCFDDYSYGLKLFKCGSEIEKLLSIISIGIIVFMIGNKFNIIKYFDFIIRFIKGT